MKGLRIDVDLDVMVGSVITQVCFGGFHFTLHFDKDIRLTVESDCELIMRSGVTTRIDDYRIESTRLCGLIGAQISAADRDASGGLILRFKSADVLHIMNSKVAYESFQLHVGSKVYVA